MAFSPQVPRIPLEDFFRNPQKAGFSIAPDGAHIAFLQPWKDRMNVFITATEGGKTHQLTFEEDRSVAGFFWGNEKRLLYVRDQGGDENFRIYGVNLDGSDRRDLTPFEEVQARLVDDLEDDKDHILVGLNRRSPEVHDVYRLHIYEGAMELIAENPGNIVSWMTDNQGRLRIAVATDGVNQRLLHRRSEAEAWQTVLETDFRESLSPLFFDFDDGDIVYAASNLGRDKAAIVRYDLGEKRELEVIFSHSQVDVGTLLRSKKRRKITGVAYTDDFRRYQFFDEERRMLQANLEAELPGYEVVLAGRNDQEDQCLVRTYSDRSRGAYYHYDTNTQQLRHLADLSPWLEEEHLAPMHPRHFEARDGLGLQGYLTLPVGYHPEAHGPIAMVLNPHGGPWARDAWGFNPEVQFLANRGYAVLQVNFRGSTGFGRAFWESSFKQWGRAMQADLTDGVQHMIDQGMADARRVGIYGGSYGGYAVLAGLAFTPERYACGVDYVGVSNLFTLLASVPPYWKPMLEMMYQMVGHPEKDEQLLREASPLFFADRIKAPLLVAQGANDPRVKQQESDQIVEALQARGIDVQYIVKEDEGHGFANQENRFEFYRAMESFLEEHLQGVPQDTPDTTPPNA
jgi:dipeptidyl aminopeptidase/acylaminoacyl peptidase